MNNLTLFLYLAEVIGNLRASLGIILFLIAVCSLPVTIGAFLIVENNSYDSEEEVERKYEIRKTIWKCIKVVAIVFPILVLIKTLLPSKETMYMMAASELGETVVTSPDAVQVYDKVKKIINQELDDLVKKEK